MSSCGNATSEYMVLASNIHPGSTLSWLSSGCFLVWRCLHFWSLHYIEVKSLVRSQPRCHGPAVQLNARKRMDLDLHGRTVKNCPANLFLPPWIDHGFERPWVAGRCIAPLQKNQACMPRLQNADGPPKWPKEWSLYCLYSRF